MRNALVIISTFILYACDTGADYDAINVDEKNKGKISSIDISVSNVDRGITIEWFLNLLGIKEKDSVCRSTITSPDPVYLYSQLKDRGIVSCPIYDKAIIYYREEGGSCNLSLSGVESTESINSTLAEDEFQICTPIGKASSLKETGVIMITPAREEYDENLINFNSFFIDLNGLSIRGGLPITHLFLLNDVICIETPFVERTNSYIESFEIVDSKIAEYTTHTGSCRNLVPEMFDMTWPEILGVQK